MDCGLFMNHCSLGRPPHAYTHLDIRLDYIGSEDIHQVNDSSTELPPCCMHSPYPLLVGVVGGCVNV